MSIDINNNIKDDQESLEPTIYEASFLIDNQHTDEDVVAKYESIKAFLSSYQAELISEGVPESKKLAYTISVKRDSKRKDHTKAYFAWIKFALPQSAISAFDAFLKNDSSIIRFLIIKTVRENTLREPMEGIDDTDVEDVEDESEIDVAEKEDNTQTELSNEKEEVL